MGKAPLPTTDDQELDEILMFGFESQDFVDDLIGRERLAKAKQAILNRYISKEKVREAEIRARIEGMEQAKSRVLRRTEIPKDAKNPTRDVVVEIGEVCADIIQQDIAELRRELGLEE